MSPVRLSPWITRTFGKEALLHAIRKYLWRKWWKDL